MPFAFCIAVLPHEIVDQGLSWAWDWAWILAWAGRRLGDEVEYGRRAVGRWCNEVL